MNRTLIAFLLAVIFLLIGVGYIAYQSRIIEDLKEQPPQVVKLTDTLIHTVKETLELPKDTLTIVRERTVVETLDRLVIRYDTILAPIDTYAVVRDYYLKRIQKDTIYAQDVLAYITDTVYMNRILGREIVLQNLSKVPIQSKVWKVYAGGYAGTNGNNFTAGIGLLAMPKKQNFTFGYLFDATRQTHNLAIFGKISFRK